MTDLASAPQTPSSGRIERPPIAPRASRSGIPAIDAPQFTPAEEVKWLRDREPVISLNVGSETRAYPIQILNMPNRKLHEPGA